MEQVHLDENGEPLSKKALAKLKKEQEKERRKQETAARLAAEKAAREAADVDYAADKYGVLPVNQSSARHNETRVRIADITPEREGERIKLRARVHTSRAQGNKLCFFQLRQGFDTIQAVLTVEPEHVSKHMVKFAAGINAESLVVIDATVVRSPEPVKSCSVQDAELRVHQVFVESTSAERLPFTLEDASRPEADFENTEAKYVRVNLDTPIFRIQSGVCQLFREFLYARGFTEIHSPKLLGAASEGGASVFEVNYFKGRAYLAQSPQFYKQMMICADFDKVFEIGPHYHEVLDLFDELFVSIFKGLETRFAKELEAVNRQYPFEPFQFLEKSLRLTYPEAIAMLREAGVEIADDEDLNTEKERILGKLVKAKYNTDFFMLDKFPLAMYSNSYDFFMRGEEILSGAQRVHDPVMLEERAREHGVDPSTIQPYLDAFKYGVPPHAGGGIGLERVIMLYLNLFNIRRTSLFPRDPTRLEP
ncbi:hypothetical protein BCR44DRAFT_1444149 [Catenaria anguillulae PL171]|uniref:Aspartate--tRNA ligase, cytoplasmic n=1 Tax=Catenaria anguillulae PL171 TaxID=765915 RepID=A0A1Y2H7Z3_9FUNG|nr:hypothetical protein BCR44DRAFT_1444149 [Catenaria anguillulae PL171]